MNQHASIFWSLLLIIALSSCIRMGTPIKPDFEQKPPVATKISFEILERTRLGGNNLRVVAEFSAPIKGKFLAVNINAEKTVLRDDGKGADDVAADNKYSIFIEEDIEALLAELAHRKQVCLGREEGHTFSNRCIKNIDLHSIPDLDFDNLEKGKLFEFPIDLLELGLDLELDSKKSLMITDLGVVEDPSRTFNPCTQTGNARGVWTFGELMRQMASPNPGNIASDAEVSTFVMNWLDSWLTDTQVNEETLPARTRLKELIIDPWQKKSIAAGAPVGELKMELAPFKLTAIVNRLDLRGNAGFGFEDAGEGRFVFAALGDSCKPLQFNVIFEYGININSCAEIKTYAQEWADLNALTLGSSEYNAALGKITAQFTQSGTNTAKANQNSLNQLRTNEVALGIPWELREFNLADSGLELVTVKMEPAVKYNAKIANADVELLARFIKDNEAKIEAEDFEVPERINSKADTSSPKVAFLGGKAHTNFPPVGLPTASNPVTGGPTTAHHWDGDTVAGSPAFITGDSARHIFSLTTCSGCHAGETQTFFTHIDPVGFGTEATLSGFLTGTPGRGLNAALSPVDADGDPSNGLMTVPDPAGRPNGAPQLRQFNDLERRNIDLVNLLSSLCQKSPFLELVHILTFEPNRMVH